MRRGEARSRQFARRLRKELTEAEVVLWTFLRKRALNGYKFRRQHPIGPYIADFACASERVVVEVDGATHWTREQLDHDTKRTAFLEAKGWRVVRVTNLDVFENMDGVWQTVARVAYPSGFAAFLPRERGGNWSEP